MDYSLSELEEYAYTNLYFIVERQYPVTPQSVLRVLLEKANSLGRSPLIRTVLATAPTAQDGTLSEAMFLEFVRATVTSLDPWDRVAVLHGALYIVQDVIDELNDATENLVNEILNLQNMQM